MSVDVLYDPKDAAIQTYSELFEYHAEQEQLQVHIGNVTEASKHHEACRALALAVKDEIDDFKPEGLGK
jgi:hypothetical protein